MTGRAADAESKNLRGLLAEGRERILHVETDVPALEAQLLLALAIGKSREYILAHPEYIPTHKEATAFEDLVRRRENYEPIAYILGEKEFYSIPFKCDSRALVPRPETETLVEAAFAMFDAQSAVSALEIGTGAGVISVSLAMHRPRWKITAIDISEEALSLARENIQSHNLSDRITLMIADLFPPGEARFDLIVGNPPYIPSGQKDLRPDIIRHEPPVSLYGGSDGLDLIRKIVAIAPSRLNPGGALALEMGHIHMEEVRELIEKTGFFKTINTHLDQHGIERVVSAKG